MIKVFKISWAYEVTFVMRLQDSSSLVSLVDDNFGFYCIFSLSLVFLYDIHNVGFI